MDCDLNEKGSGYLVYKPTVSHSEVWNVCLVVIWLPDVRELFHGSVLFYMAGTSILDPNPTQPSEPSPTRAQMKTYQRASRLGCNIISTMCVCVWTRKTFVFRLRYVRILVSSAAPISSSRMWINKARAGVRWVDVVKHKHPACWWKILRTKYGDLTHICTTYAASEAPNAREEPLASKLLLLALH
jgi:hypothetical protein